MNDLLRQSQQILFMLKQEKEGVPQQARDIEILSKKIQ